MTFHLRPMNCTLYWFMLSMLYLNLLFVDNSVVEEANYTDSGEMGLNERGSFLTNYFETTNILSFGRDRFTFKVHQRTFKSFVAFKSGIVLMADAFESGKPVRSFRIVDGNSSQIVFHSHAYSNAVDVDFAFISYCKSHPGTSVNLRMYVFKDGTIQYQILMVRENHEDCPITIEITDGNYIGGADGSGTTINEEVIHKKAFPSSSIVVGRVFTFVPQLRCRSQLDQLSCKAESKLNAVCTWCLNCKICVQNTSICNCSEKVETTVSEVNGLNDNGSSTEFESSKATTQRHDRANGMSTVVHGITDSIMNTNDNNDSTIDSETSKGTTQRQDVEKRKSINDYKPRVTYTKLIYYILGIVLGLFVIFAVCLILWKYLYKHY